MLQSIALIFLLAFCVDPAAGPVSEAEYKWSNVTSAANYPQGYNYPVFVWGNKMVALNNGAWISNDGRSWEKAPLPDSGLNSAYLKYVQFNGSIYSLGSMTGNYEKFSISPKILRTRDLENWERDISFWYCALRGASECKGTVAVLPSSESDPYAGGSPHAETLEQRALALWRLARTHPLSPRPSGRGRVLSRLSPCGPSRLGGEIRGPRRVHPGTAAPPDGSRARAGSAQR